MYDNPYAGQLEQQVLCADPVELVALLFDHLVLRINAAREHLRSGDRMARSQAITRALAMVAELARALDLSQGGSLAANLQRLYDFTARRLTEAQIRESDQALREALHAVLPLREAWHEMEASRLGACPGGTLAANGAPRASFAFQA
jgi:flagellar protein FliS